MTIVLSSDVSLTVIADMATWSEEITQCLTHGVDSSDIIIIVVIFVVLAVLVSSLVWRVTKGWIEVCLQP